MAVTSTTSPPTAERVGRYQLLEPIGAGPCGTVSRAKVFGVAGFERQFAIKRFHTEITSSTTLASALSAAARGYGSLEHPRIARMSEFGVAQGTTFTAVEYVAGLDALRLLDEIRASKSGLAAGGALALVSQAARAVGYAHGRGLTHLGLSPTNVIVTSEGDIKITDFSILASTMPSRPVDAQRIAARVRYLAPEQVAGEATSAATDVFALGVLAYELITLRRAYDGETPQQIAAAILAGPPPEPSLPRPIVRVLQRCVARSPFERFPDARALADALDAALRVAPVPGTRKDIGAQVKTTMDRITAMREGEHSGVLQLGMVANAAPRKEPLSKVEVLGNTDPRTTKEIHAAALESGHKISGPMSTVAGIVAPLTPTSPVPPGVTPPPPSIDAPQKMDHKTIMGIPSAANPAGAIGKPPPIPGLSGKPGAKPAAIPAIPTLGKPSTGTPPLAVDPKATAARRPPILNVDTQPGVEPAVKIPEGHALDLGDDDEVELQLDRLTAPRAPVKAETDPGIGTSREPDRANRPTNEMSAQLAKQLAAQASKPTRDLQRMEPAPSDSADDLEMSFAETAMVLDKQKIDLDLGNKDGAESAAADDLASTLDLSDRQSGAERTNVDMRESESFAAVNLDKTGLDKTAIEEDAKERAAARRRDDDDDDDDVADNLDRTVLGTGAVAAAAMARPIATKLGFTGPNAPPVKLQVSSTKPGTPATGSPASPMARPPTPEPVSTFVPQPVMPPVTPIPMPMPPASPTETVTTQKSKKGLWAVVAILGVGALGAGGFFAYQQFLAPKSDATGSAVAVAKDAAVASPTSDASVVATATDASATTVVDAAVAAITIDAAGSAAAVVDAGVAATTVDAGATTPPVATGDLSITSAPPGARVFIDGADSGVTPLKLPGTADKHSIALFLPAHELYVAQVDGKGTFTIQLKPVTPLAGPAGIKVTRCKDKDRYYVSVDGKPTGQTCPTERLQVELGPHTVEVYDLQTEKHTEYKVEVTDTRLSYRVKVDP